VPARAQGDYELDAVDRLSRLEPTRDPSDWLRIVGWRRAGLGRHRCKTHAMVEEAGDEDLTANVLTWLNGHGAPFEMLTAQTFARFGAHVQQGRYVIDPDTKKSREVDVIAGKQTVLVDHGIVGVWASVECKYASDKPCVLYRGTEYWEPRPIFNRINTTGVH
jgi:hypothetical protein